MATPYSADPTRAYGGFSVLNGGLDSGSASSLLATNQYSLGINLTNRGDFVVTRPPWEQKILTIDQVTSSRFTGKYQGVEWYDGENGESGWIVARGGKLFKITMPLNGINTVTEITPVLLIQTTNDFTVPAPAATVMVDVTDEAPFATGDTIIIDSGTYTVTNRFTHALLLTYVGGAANAVALSGNAVYDSFGVQVKLYETHSPDYDFVFIFQAENYAIICRNQYKTVFYDGTTSRLAGPGEIPPCLFGAYGWGRIWFVLDNRRFYGAGDLVFGPSGTPSLGFRDAILKVTENDFLNEGGFFGIPSDMGPITSMQFLATQDTSLGIGPLLVGTTNGVFSNQAPVDRTTWKNLTYPIQTISLLDYGPVGPRFVMSVNGDMMYRSLDGARSFIVARRNFPSPGNTPLSFEVSPFFDEDTHLLLFFGSGMLFDNRVLWTVSPARKTLGITHAGIVSLNLDLVSSLQRKDPLSWESLWSGLNILQLAKARIDNEERGFMFAERNGELVLWEILRDGFYDVSASQSGFDRTLNRTAIQQVLITRSDAHGDPTELKNLYSAEIYVDELVDNVSIKVEWRPDQYPAFTEWATVGLCATVSQCTLSGGATCTVFTPTKTGYAARIMLPQPPEACSQNGFPIRNGFEFEYRLTITGHCRFRRFKPHAKRMTMEMEGSGGCAETQCMRLTDCGQDLYSYSSYGS